MSIGGNGNMKKFSIFFVTLCMCIMFSVTVMAMSESENNDTAAKADLITLGDDINAAISASGDVDFYKFTISSSGTVKLTITSYMQYYCMYVYDSNGEELWYTDFNEWNSTLQFRTDSYFVDLEQGTYYIKVTGYRYGENGVSTGKYVVKTSFTASGANIIEPNNSFAEAKSVYMGNTIKGFIAENDRYDIYKTTLSSSGRISLTITSYMKYYCIYVYNSNGEELWYTDFNEWNENLGYRTDTHLLDLERGTYYIKITGYRYGENGASTGKYTIKTGFTASGSNIEEPNNSLTEAKNISYGKAVKGQIALNDRYDIYKINITSENIRINFTSYMQYYSLYIYDKNGNEIWYTDFNEYDAQTGKRSDVHYPEVKSGTYYIKITGYRYGENGASTGNYSFSVNKTATSIKLSSSSVKLNIKNKKTIKAVISPVTGEKVSWRSEDSSIVSINSSGVITAKKAGVTKIIATVGNGITKECKVTVKPKKTTIKRIRTKKYTSWWGNRYYDVTLTNKSVKNVRYQVYMRKPGSKKYKKIGEYSNAKNVITLDKRGTYYFKVRTYIYADGKNVYSDWSKIKKIKVR